METLLSHMSFEKENRSLWPLTVPLSPGSLHGGALRAYTLSLAESLLPVGRKERVFIHVGDIDDLTRFHGAELTQGSVDKIP